MTNKINHSARARKLTINDFQLAGGPEPRKTMGRLGNHGLCCVPQPTNLAMLLVILMNKLTLWTNSTGNAIHQFINPRLTLSSVCVCVLQFAAKNKKAFTPRHTFNA